MDNSSRSAGWADVGRWLALLLISTVGAAAAERLDPTFDPGTGPNGLILSVLPLSDGRILVAGNFDQWNGAPANHLVRLEATGALDSSFVAPTDPGFRPHQLWPGVEGKVLVGGDIRLGGDAQRGLTQLSSDGSIDPGFQARLDAEPTTVIILPDGRLGIAGGFTQVGLIRVPSLARLETNGVPDTEFNLQLANLTGAAHSLVALPDGSWLVAGLNAESSNISLSIFGLLRIRQNGSADLEYRLDGFGLSAATFAGSVSTLPDRSVLLTGIFELHRLTPEGYLDPTYLPDAVPGGPPDRVAVLPDGSLLAVASRGVVVGGQPRGVIRVKANGQLDEDFQIQLTAGPTAGVIVPTSIRPTRQGEIYIAGPFDMVDGLPRAGLARLLPTDPGALPKIQWNTDQIAFARRPGEVTLTVIREGNLAVPAEVDFATRDDTAPNGTFSFATNGTVHFGAGESFSQIRLALPIPNSELGDHPFAVVLTNALALTSTVTLSNQVSLVTEVTVTQEVTVTNRVISTNEITFTNELVLTNQVTVTSEIISTNEITLTNVVTVVAEMPVTNVVTITNQITLTNVVSNTNLVTLTNLVALTNAVTRTNLVTLTNELTMTNIVSVTNLVATTNFVAVANPALTQLGALTELVVHLIDDRSEVEFSTDALSASEVDGAFRLNFNRIGGLGAPVAIRWRVTSNPGTDFGPTNGIVVFGTSEPFTGVNFALHDNAQAEGNRTYRVELSQGDFRGTPGRIATNTITILDNDSSGFGGDGLDGPILQFLPLGPDRTLALGLFSTVHGVSQASAAWLRNDGRIAELARLPVGPSNGPAVRLVGAPASNGGILIAGTLNSGGGAPDVLVRFSVDGTIDPSFNSSSVPNGLISLASLPDGGALLLGDSSFYNGTKPIDAGYLSRGPLRHILPTGSPDETFETYATLTGIPQLVVLPDARFLVSGLAAYSTAFAANPPVDAVPLKRDLVQFLPNGSVDPNFTVTLKASVDRLGRLGGTDLISSFWRQADGQIVVLGSFTNVNGHPMTSLARLGTTGDPDLGFPSEAPVAGTIFVTGVALANGGFVALTTDPKSSFTPTLRWYDATGRTDTRFPTHLIGSSDRQKLRLAALPDGTVFVGGGLRTVSAQTRYRFAYFTPDGRLGTDQPLASLPFLPVAGNRPGIDFIARAAGVGYVLEHSNTLGDWVSEPPVSLAPGQHRFTFDPGAATQGFYRVRWQP